MGRSVLTEERGAPVASRRYRVLGTAIFRASRTKLVLSLPVLHDRVRSDLGQGHRSQGQRWRYSASSSVLRPCILGSLGSMTLHFVPIVVR
ncbi:hypothetical protein J6590_040206 [Homalodisca vitripennis]|nr:hypothetical protein J6590_040206 [Homalodisca vitripennis]